MRIEKIENIRPHNDKVTLKTMGRHIYEVRTMSRTSIISIRKLDADNYLDLGTGEIKEFKHRERRTDNIASVKQSLKKLRELINTNVTDASKVLFVTLTYAENMTDPKRLYEDYRRFNMRLVYYCKKESLPDYEYIAVMEPQLRGCLHVHALIIFQEKAPFIPSADLAEIWGWGFVKIKALSNTDNIGAYLSAYLSDMELGEAINTQNKKINGFKTVESIDKDGKQQSKAIVKGARLWLYPKGFRLFRKSKGIVAPTIKECTNAEAMQEIGDAALTYEKTIRVVDDDGKIFNVINYRHYNSAYTGND